jgi:hypothetical protein
VRPHGIVLAHVVCHEPPVIVHGDGALGTDALALEG